MEPGEIAGSRVQIEPDLSNAGPFLAAALVTGGTVRIPNWPSETTQVGADFAWLLSEMGAHVSLAEETLTLTGTGTINGGQVLHSRSEVPHRRATPALT